MLVCDIEKNPKGLLCSKSPMCTLSQNGYGAHKVAVGFNSLGLPMKNCLRQCLGQGLRLEVILLSNEKKQPPPTQAPRQASRRASRHREAGLEACFEQVAQGLWLVRRVHRRSKTISLPGRLKLPTLRLIASRSNQLSYGSLCRRPKLVPQLEKRLENSWLQMVCQTKGSSQSKGFSKACGKGSNGDNYTQPGSNWRPSTC